MKNRKLAINGRILEFPITGVGRFFCETIRELDHMVDKGSCELLVSKGAKNIPDLKNIQVKVIGKYSGIAWEQISLPCYIRRNKCEVLNMSNSIPVVSPGYVVIHDISLKINKQDTSSIKEKLKIWWPLLHYKISARFAKKIFTVSEFQKSEIIKAYKVDPKRIIVVYNGWQHMLAIDEDRDIISRYKLSKGNYFFAVSTRAKNKNFKWILNAAKHNPNFIFVIAGKMETKYFSDTLNLDSVKNIVTTGYVSDGEVKALMHYCRAFIYPSIYEGFGIPPLEAMSLGTKAIVSCTSCMPEVYGNSVWFIDPNESCVDIEKLMNKPLEGAGKVLEKYSWCNTAKKIYLTIFQ